jgi:hypothetical protein
MEREGRLPGDKAGRLHLLGPQPVVRRDDELRTGTLRLQELAELVAVASIDGHDDIIKQRECEPLSEQPLHVDSSSSLIAR